MTPSKKESQLQPMAAKIPVAITDASPAANDDSMPTFENDLRNPLWIIAVGMAWFFGIAAAVIAFS